MRKVMLSLFVMGSVFVGSVALAGVDPGTPDTAALVVSVRPEVGPPAQLKVQVDLYGYNDENLIGLSGGYKWINPNLTLDSAKASPLITGLGANIGPFFYLVNNKDSSNYYDGFQFGWALLLGSPIPATAGRQLWASFFFTLSSWAVTDSIVLDSVDVGSDTANYPPGYGSGQGWIWVSTGQNSYQPQWAGRVV
ncbi:MAG TPA: hypothetical protein VN285_00485, partial [Candidatus Deferrimicrobium sp.]|nr:hypothetical protein [Candidatus Deferrimicrobium sp.]